MPKKLVNFEFGQTGGRFECLRDGHAYGYSEGKDYKGKPKSFRAAAGIWARDNGYTLTTELQPDGKTVVMQAREPDERALNSSRNSNAKSLWKGYCHRKGLDPATGEACAVLAEFECKEPLESTTPIESQ